MRRSAVNPYQHNYPLCGSESWNASYFSFATCAWLQVYC